MKFTIAIATSVLVLVCLAPCLQAGVIVATVHFDQNTYAIAPGQSFDAKIYYDADSGTGGDQAFAVGLWSFGLKLTYDPVKAKVSTLADIVPVPELDYNIGTGAPPAEKELDNVTGYAKVRGGISADAFEDSEFYTGTLLATITITDLSPGSYTLTLGRNHPTGDYFLDGDGNACDGNIDWGTAQVTVTEEEEEDVIPEPASLLLLGLTGLALVRRRRA